MSDDGSGSLPGKGFMRGWPGGPLWVRALLVVSLSVNLAIAGIVVGHALDDDGPRKFKFDPVERIKKVLPDHRGPLIDEIMERREEGRAAQRAALGEAEAAVVAAFRAEPFDSAALAAAMAARRAVFGERVQAMEEDLVTLAAQLTPEEREKLAKKLVSRKRGKGDWHGDRKDKKDKDDDDEDEDD